MMDEQHEPLPPLKWKLFWKIEPVDGEGESYGNAYESSGEASVLLASAKVVALSLTQTVERLIIERKL